MEFIIIFLIFKIILNQDIIDIKSFDIYQIQRHQKDIIFKYNYLSNIKADIIIYITPISEEKIIGEFLISSDLDSVINKRLNKRIKKLQLNYDSKKSIVINNYDPVNVGQNIYYISLSGNIICDFEIFLSNENINLYPNKSYYFPSIYNMTASYLSLELNINMDHDIFLNIFKNNKSCNIIKLYENGEEMSCNQEISEYTLLNKFRKYSMKIFYDYNIEDIAINFLENIVQDLILYKNNLLFIDNSELYFFIDCKFYTINTSIGIGFNYDSKCEFEIYYLKTIDEKKLPDIENIDSYNYLEFKNQNSFLLDYYNETLRYILIKVKIIKNLNIPLKIEVYNNIYYIKEIPFNFNIKSDKYYFIIDEELKNKYYDIENLILLKFNSPNNMVVYTLNNNNIFRGEIYYGKIDTLSAISFNNYIEGDFQINFLSLEMTRKIINYKNDFNRQEQYGVFTKDKGELTEIIESNTEKIIYLNLIIGNCSFYSINNINYAFHDLNEISDENKKSIKEMEIINSGMTMLILKFKINSFSMFESFIQKNDNLDNNILLEPGIKYFRNKLIYEIDFLSFPDNILVKLLTPNKNISIYNNHSEFFLNSNNQIIYLNESGKYFIKGQNSLVAFYAKLTEDKNYYLCDNNNKEFYNIKEIFIIPNITNYDAIYIFITCLDDKNNNISLNYLIDYNIIPFTRKKVFDFKRILLKNREKASLVIKNYYKGNKIINNINKEKLFAYLMFDTNISKINIEIKYINQKFLSLNEYIILEPGFNQLFLGYEYNYFVKINLCNNKKINYTFSKDAILNESLYNFTKYNIISSDEILYLKNDIIDNHYNLYLNNEKEILVSFTNEEIRNNISDSYYNFIINMKYINIENKEIHFEFYPISSYSQVEYNIFIFDSNDNVIQENLCYIMDLIEKKLYKYREIIISNSDELIINKYINLNEMYNEGNNYILLIMAKELINSYYNYKFYKPYIFNFKNKDNEEDEEKNKENESYTVLILIIIGIIISVILIALTTIFFIRKRKRNRQINDNYDDYNITGLMKEVE